MRSLTLPDTAALSRLRVRKRTVDSAMERVKEPVKHRACDECRTRKLACSKEPDGCARCKREGIACRYSPQKTMGRPRKKQPQQTSDIGDDNCHPEIDGSWQVNPTILDHGTPMFLDAAAAALPVDPNFDSDMSFLDFLGPDFISSQPLQAFSLPREIPTERGLLNIDIDFDSHTSSPEVMLQKASTSSAAFQETIPQQTHNPGIDQSSQPSIPAATLPTALQPSPCACLSNLYLALSSLHSLPKDITTAIAVARGACHTAHDSLQCPVCSPPIHEPIKHPMLTFTTMMTLGSLLPCLAEAYRQILADIDQETLRAIMSTENKKSQLDFSLAAHGGIWATPHEHASPSPSSSPDPHMQQEGTASCTKLLERFNKEDMDPAQWRLTLRALLKVDVYGLSRCDSGEGFVQVGLRDLVAQWDKRSRERHAQTDLMLEAGLAPVGLAGMHQKHTDLGTPPCQQVIAIAREAINNIIIA